MHEFRQKLEELARMGTVSPFSRLSCELIAVRVEKAETGSPALRRRFDGFVEAELRYHTSLRQSAERPRIENASPALAAHRRRTALMETLDALNAVPTRHDEEEGTRRLLMAECNFHLGMYDRSVAHLEAAIELGVEDPTAHLCLGHARHVLALQAFTLQVEDEDLLVTDEARFRTAILDAVTAFEDALSGGPMDPEVYWWIGTCLAQAGFTEASRDAMTRARPPEGVSMAPGEEAAVEGRIDDDPLLPEISVSEVRRVKELAARSYTVAEIMGETGLDEA